MRIADSGCGHCDVFLFFRMKCLVIFLVLTLVVFMAEPGESKGYGALKTLWGKAKKGWKGKSQLNIHSVNSIFVKVVDNNLEFKKLRPINGSQSNGCTSCNGFCLLAFLKVLHMFYHV